MALWFNIILNSYSVVILLILLINSIYQKIKRDNISDNLFISMICITVFLLVMDTFGRFDGENNQLYLYFNQIGNFMLFIFNLTIPAVWILYVHYQIYENVEKVKKISIFLFCICVANSAMTVVSLFTGWYYKIDSNNIYFRGPAYLVPVIAAITMVAVASVYIFYNRKKMEKKEYYSLMFFPMAPVVCTFLSLINDDVSILLNGIVISLLLIYQNIQNYRVNIDYLTGAYNRKKLEQTMGEWIAATNSKKTFSAVMIDLDGLKNINDSLGHAKGDEALVNFTKIIRKCIGKNDFFARISGDEFCILLETSDEKKVKEIVDEMSKKINEFNESEGLDYKILFSEGYAVYDYDSKMTEIEFFKYLDEKMYDTKIKKRK